MSLNIVIGRIFVRRSRMYDRTSPRLWLFLFVLLLLVALYLGISQKLPACMFDWRTFVGISYRKDEQASEDAKDLFWEYGAG